MAISANILERKTTHFVIWRPLAVASPPRLIIGQIQVGNPPTLTNQNQFQMTPAAGVTGLWEIAATACGLTDGQVYHYWFEIEDTRSSTNPRPTVRCTDPMAFTVDWRLFPSLNDNRQPASAVKFANGKLVPCDAGGEEIRFDGDVEPDTLPTNNRLVIYELPTAWVMSRGLNQPDRAVGTFRDTQALVDEKVGGANFSDLALLQPGNSYLTDLGINAIELLPPADSFFKREWGYDTAHFLAPDYELGFPEGNASPTSNTDLIALVKSCHAHGIRFFIDAVMAFGREEAYQHIDFPDFCIEDPKHHQDDPDALTSTRGFGKKEVRDGFGSTLFRYTRAVAGPVYNPISGKDELPLVPARQLMFAYLTRWARDFHIDGIRLDSVENLANWDFVGGFRDLGHSLNKQRFIDQGVDPARADERFLVVGEELSLPFDILTQRRLDGLWNDTFHSFVRAAILGQNADGEPSFEWTVRKAIDCRIIGFPGGQSAINYITSHDVQGFRRERLFTMLRDAPDAEKRIKLAFVCLLTAVGIPMILAGEEFADQHDLFNVQGNVDQGGGKQIDPVNFSRLTDNPQGDDDDSKRARAVAEMRRRIFTYVSRLVKFRTTKLALSVDDTDFIHVDFNDSKRVVVWKRGGPGQDPVVVVANFSDFVTANAGTSGAIYQVPNWPITPPGRGWREVTQDRPVAPEFVSREPIFPWEAKVYTLV